MGTENADNRNQWIRALVIAYLLVVAALLGFRNLGQSVVRPGLGGTLVDGVAIGIIAMAMIQIVRFLVPIRGGFHRARVAAWLKRGQGERTLADLLPHVAGQPVDAQLHYFDLPIEQLVAQLSAAFDRVLTQPVDDKWGRWMLGAAGLGDNEELLKILKEGPPQASSSPEDAGGSAQADKYLQTRLAVEEGVRREFDRLQIEVTYTWRRYLRIAALTTSVILGVGGAAVGSRTLVNQAPMLFAGLLGGFVAMLSRDVVAVIEKLRK